MRRSEQCVQMIPAPFKSNELAILCFDYNYYNPTAVQRHLRVAANQDISSEEKYLHSKRNEVDQ